MAGIKANFDEHDILRCLFFIYQNEKISRAGLMELLELGEGSVRGILDILKGKKLIKSTQKGHSFTKKGKEHVRNILNTMEMPQRITLNSVYKGLKKSLLIIKKYNKKIKINCLLRDIAVKNNAEGSIIGVYKTKIIFPGCDGDDFKSLEKELSDIKLSHGNILIIPFAHDYRTAENSAIAMACFLNKNLQFLPLFYSK